MAAKLLEGVVKSGWEVVSSAEFTTTPGFELVTWVFKRSATPIGDGNGAVVALMLTPPNRSVTEQPERGQNQEEVACQTAQPSHCTGLSLF